MGALPEVHITAVETDQLRYPEAGLNAEKQQGTVASAVPGREVRGGEERLDLIPVEIFNRALLAALCGHCEYLLAVVQEPWFGQGDELEERADRRQPGVAAAGTVAAPALEGTQEPPDKLGIDVGKQKIGWLPVETAASEQQEQHEGVAITCHRVGAGAELTLEALSEEALDEQGKWVRRHDSSPSLKACSARSLASFRSSGTASMYHQVPAGLAWPR